MVSSDDVVAITTGSVNLSLITSK